MTTREETEFWNDGFGVFEDNRPRDPKWLTEYNGLTRKGEYERAECCWDQVRYVCEVPRRRPSGSKVIELPPARLRLCKFHANVLLASDPEASIHKIGRASV